MLFRSLPQSLPWFRPQPPSHNYDVNKTDISNVCVVQEIVEGSYILDARQYLYHSTYIYPTSYLFTVDLMDFILFAALKGMDDSTHWPE